MADRMTTTPVTVPAGFVLVPEELTEEMLEAWFQHSGESDLMRQTVYERARRYHRAMIVARPAITAGTDAGAVDWPAPKVTNPDIANPTGTPYLDCLLHRLLDAQQDVNEHANTTMSQELANVSALMDELEAAIRELGGRVTPETAEAVPVAAQPGEAVREPLYLIRKGGGFYRPNSQGYTLVAAEAGRYTLAEAEDITHPNGPDGSRDGMDYVPAPALASVPAPAGNAEHELPDISLRGIVKAINSEHDEDITRLRVELEEARQRLTYAYGAKHRCNEDANYERHARKKAEAERNTALSQLDDALRENRTARAIISDARGSWWFMRGHGRHSRHLLSVWSKLEKYDDALRASTAGSPTE